MWWYVQTAIGAVSKDTHLMVDYWLNEGDNHQVILINLPDLVVIQREATIGLWVWWRTP